MALRREAFLDRVTERGQYGTPDEAERLARVVLALLGAHLVGEVRAELAARLPEGFARTLLNPPQSAEPLPPERFVHTTAARDVTAVLSTVADTAGEDLTGQIPLQPPVGHDLLFGRPQPT